MSSRYPYWDPVGEHSEDIGYDDLASSADQLEWFIAGPPVVSDDSYVATTQPHYGELPLEAPETEDYANEATLDLSAQVKAPDPISLTMAAQTLFDPPWDRAQLEPDVIEVETQGTLAPPLDPISLTQPPDPFDRTMASQLLFDPPWDRAQLEPDVPDSELANESTLEDVGQFFPPPVTPDDGLFAAQDLPDSASMEIEDAAESGADPLEWYVVSLPAPDEFTAQPDPSLGQDIEVSYPADPDELTQVSVEQAEAVTGFLPPSDEILAAQPAETGSDLDALFPPSPPELEQPWLEVPEAFVSGPPDAFDVTAATAPSADVGQDADNFPPEPVENAQPLVDGALEVLIAGTPPDQVEVTAAAVWDYSDAQAPEPEQVPAETLLDGSAEFLGIVDDSYIAAITDVSDRLTPEEPEPPLEVLLDGAAEFLATAAPAADDAYVAALDAFEQWAWDDTLYLEPPEALSVLEVGVAASELIAGSATYVIDPFVEDEFPAAGDLGEPWGFLFPPVPPVDKDLWTAGPPRAKWHAGALLQKWLVSDPTSKWGRGRPAPKWVVGEPHGKWDSD